MYKVEISDFYNQPSFQISIGRDESDLTYVVLHLVKFYDIWYLYRGPANITMDSELTLDQVYGCYSEDLEVCQPKILESLTNGDLKIMFLKRFSQELTDNITNTYAKHLDLMNVIADELPTIESSFDYKSKTVSDWSKEFCSKFPGIGETVMNQWFATVMAVGFDNGISQNT